MDHKLYEAFPDIALPWRTPTSQNFAGDLNFQPEIQESWHRCYAEGVNPYDGISHLSLDSMTFNNILKTHQKLISAAKIHMDSLYEFIRGSGFILMLSDEQGYLIEVFGDFNAMELASRVNLMPGYRWREEECGTNGIGTAIALKKPVQVSGREHFCRKLHIWTCSAAPIFDGNKGVIGSLQVSGPAGKAHPHTLGLVASAVSAISDNIRKPDRNQTKSGALSNCLGSIIQTMPEAALVTNRHGRIRQINSTAKDLFGRNIVDASLQDIFEKPAEIEKIFDDEEKSQNVTVMADTAMGFLPSTVTVAPIRDESGQLTNAIILFKSANPQKKQKLHIKGASARYSFEDIIGHHESLREAIRMATKASASISHVLIKGESGTGKELFAQAIHNQSARRDGPFVAVNCAALPQNLVISELFGYADGTFTGGQRGGKPGKFEMAAGGTLFLDEIGDMPLDQQAALLRVLQEGKITRLGSNSTIPIDVRIICATNKDLQEAVQNDHFRQDLFYRLNVVLISLPPLRSRGDDLFLLFDYFLRQISEKLKVDIQFIAPEIKHYLEQYHWPGNLRELSNVVEKLINATDDGRIGIEHLPTEIRLPDMNCLTASTTAGGKKIRKVLAEKERQVIIGLLEQHRGNISRIARDMGVSRNTIYRKMQVFGIQRGHRFS